MGLLAAITSITVKSSARHEAEIAAIIGGVGAILIIVGAAMGLRLLPAGAAADRAERVAYLLGGLLIGLGFLLFLLAIHGGFGSVTVR
ncbi:MAG: hypothetical protein JOZ99_00155 [Actinobacteria bacterium]|nr:hypothetical protein [Actinomycetota bacterium]